MIDSVQNVKQSRRLIWALGIAQIVSWGSLFYGFPLFVLPMMESFGWSLPLVNGAATIGLMTAGLCAYPIGALIDRHGGRVVMGVGSLGVATLLALWSSVTHVYQFYLIWVGLGACMAAVLYDPVFIVLTRRFNSDAKHAITLVTLIAGFSGTIFIPLVELMLELLSWRQALVILAVGNLLFCVPIHFLMVPNGNTGPAGHVSEEQSTGSSTRALMSKRLRDPVFWGLALWFTACSGTAAGILFQIVPYLKSIGVDQAVMLMTVALIGPMQVMGRIIVMSFGEKMNISTVGGCISLLMPLSVLCLVFLPPELRWLGFFSVSFGLANGIFTIIRGIAPADWLGQEEYGRLMGALGFPSMLATALAPLMTAIVWSKTGDPLVMLWALFALALVGFLGYLVAAGNR